MESPLDTQVAIHFLVLIDTSGAPVIPPYSIAPMYAGPNAYNTSYPDAPLGMYTPPPPPPPPVYGPAYSRKFLCSLPINIFRK